ncbi:hypothetical protein I308_104719 [Cryptococcus tetragattii IND107]|uniref:Uncharacterized protein n=1 Tax=Cryptococcus tetragattii IND107 TaxID=1296105 RepID=A0ABR3BP93_9TREE
MIKSANVQRLPAAMDRDREHEQASPSSSAALLSCYPLALINSQLALFEPRQSILGQILTSSPIPIVQPLIVTIYAAGKKLFNHQSDGSEWLRCDLDDPTG